MQAVGCIWMDSFTLLPARMTVPRLHVRRRVLLSNDGAVDSLGELEKRRILVPAGMGMVKVALAMGEAAPSLADAVPADACALAAPTVGLTLVSTAL